MKLKLMAAAAACAMALGGVALAQDYTAAEPIFETVNLTSGFSNDPYTVAVVAGGENPASNVASECAGFVATAPDVRFNYEASTDWDLSIYVRSTAGDATLLINLPDGSWVCDDDSAGGANGVDPGLVFAEPMSGQYDIWIGSFAPDSPFEAELRISELPFQ